MMDDARLYEMLRDGQPVAHCRAKIRADDIARIAREQEEARRNIARRHAVLRPRW